MEDIRFDDFEDFESGMEVKKEPLDIVTVANEVMHFEAQLAEMKAIKAKLDNAKADLKDLMERAGIKKWETPNGYRVTLVADTPDKLVEEEFFDSEALKAERPDVYGAYSRTRTVTKTGRNGYVRITAPKEER